MKTCQSEVSTTANGLPILGGSYLLPRWGDSTILPVRRGNQAGLLPGDHISSSGHTGGAPGGDPREQVEDN